MKKDRSSVKRRKLSVDQLSYGYQLIPLKKIAAKEAAVLLHNAGIEVKEEEAGEIMEFLYTITQITLKEFFSPD